MLRTVRKFLTPRWLAVHLTVIAAVVAMVLLGRWQLQVSDRKHFSLQNFGYTLQWWAFSVGAVLLWLKLVRDGNRGFVSLAPSTGGELVLRNGQVSPLARVTQVGPADLVSTSGGGEIAYRGYLIPQSSTSPARSEDDRYHGSYNEYLWQLALADQARDGAVRATNTPRPAPGAPAETSVPTLGATAKIVEIESAQE